MDRRAHSHNRTALESVREALRAYICIETKSRKNVLRTTHDPLTVILAFKILTRLEDDGYIQHKFINIGWIRRNKRLAFSLFLFFFVLKFSDFATNAAGTYTHNICARIPLLINFSSKISFL